MPLISCYNRGCGKDFDPADNPEDACQHHPGLPYFHDAYKGWSCCKKKSINFTEFLNIKGCERCKHSNQKPIEPEKPNKTVVIEEPPRKPVKEFALERVDFNSPMTIIHPNISPELKHTIDNIKCNVVAVPVTIDSSVISIGTLCKNGGCKAVYKSSESDESICAYHPGTPVFHEAMKFWSCCTKRTTDFNEFLNQKGCTEGMHKWIQSKEDFNAVKCRYDWHQTSLNVVIAIYAKSYHYAKSFVKLNPIRLNVSLLFPLQENAEYNLDLELRGIIDVNQTKVQYFGTKVEITLTKAEPGNWNKLDFPRSVQHKSQIKDIEVKNDPDSDIDLDDIEAIHAVTIKDM